ncbi:unnamed protein product [Linum trigynum]|uniref:Uncharacterized protein n=1 Tax=Linum trigynum TaxID=586398 RepID=A0AAV2FFC2_9ROSI
MISFYLLNVDRHNIHKAIISSSPDDDDHCHVFLLLNSTPRLACCNVHARDDGWKFIARDDELSYNLSTEVDIATAGLSTAATLFILGSTGLMSLLYRYLPLPVVRDVQLSHGLSFAFSTVKYIQFNQDIGGTRQLKPLLDLASILSLKTSHIRIHSVTRPAAMGPEALP